MPFWDRPTRPAPPLIIPTDFVTETGQKMTIDGVDMEFQSHPVPRRPPR